MARSFTKFLLFVLVNTARCAQAQSTYVAGLFPTIDHTGALRDKVDYSLYYFAAFPLVNLQTPNAKKDAFFNLFYSEQAISYKPTAHISITGSYVYQREQVVYDNYVNENRGYVQVKFKHQLGACNLAHRLRFDARFVQNRSTGETPFTHRLRYLIGADKSINETLYLVAYEEAFFNSYKNAPATYAENWAYAAVGKKLGPKNKIELGPLYITWNTGAGAWFHQFYLQATWLSNLDFRRG